MSFGLIWFLHLDIPIQFSRIAVILCLIVGFVVPIDSPIFIIAWILFVICLIITVCTFFMHIPSNERMENFIAHYEKDFQEKLKSEFRNYSNVKITTLQCYDYSKSTKLNRWIGSKHIYGSLAMLSWVETKNEVWLIRDEKSLGRNTPNNMTRYKLDKFEDVSINIGSANINGEVIWNLQVNNEVFQFVCKEDFHFRDFLDRKPKI